MTTRTGHDEPLEPINTSRHLTVVLDDYHTEYSNFSNFQAAVNLTIQCQGLDDMGGQIVATDSDELMAYRWTITGDLRHLVDLYEELLTALNHPAWHWYGMGGDDNCYDYWPNTMDLAARFRDQLMPFIKADLADQTLNPSALIGKWWIDEIPAMLNRVYWACRARYAGDSRSVDLPDPIAQARQVQDADGYFNDDILNSDDFGPRPPWIADPNT